MAPTTRSRAKEADRENDNHGSSMTAEPGFGMSVEELASINVDQQVRGGGGGGRKLAAQLWDDGGGAPERE